MAIKHNYIIVKADNPAYDVSTSEWNENHIIDSEVAFPLIASPATPTGDKINFFVKKIAGFLFPSYVNPQAQSSALELSSLEWKVERMMPTGGTSTTAYGMSTGQVGTATQATLSNASKHQSTKRAESLVTTAATTAVAGFRSANANIWRGDSAGNGGFIQQWRFAPCTGVSTATHRLFAGLTASTAAPTDVDPSTLINMIGVGYDSADTNFQIFSNDATGIATKINLGASFPKPTTDRPGPYALTLSCAPFASTVEYEFTDVNTGAKTTGSINSDLPSNIAFLAHHAYISVGGTSSVIGFSLFDLIAYVKF